MKKDNQYTRKISPLLCILGVLGIIGPIAYYFTGETYTLGFMLFFGFFSFYFEGKMSNQLIDERFRENSMKASSIAFRTGLTMIFLSIMFSIQYLEGYSMKMAYHFLVGAVSLTFGITLTMHQYLIYKFDSKE